MTRETLRRRTTTSTALGGIAMAALVAMGSAASAAGTVAATPGEIAPQATTALYNDWQLRCVTAKEGAKACEVAAAVPTADGKGAAARVVVGQVDKTKPAQVVIQLAPGVWLPDGVSLAVAGGKAPVRLSFKQCVQVCFAQADLDEATLAALKTSDKPATLSFTDAQQQPVSLSLSLAGFKAALEAAKREM